MRALIFLLALGLSGCGAMVPVYDASDVDMATLTKARDLPVITQDQAKTMQRIGNVKGYSCRNQSFDKPATRVGALNQVKISAAIEGANAITTPICTDTGFSMIKNCWSSWECTATAYR